MKNIFKGVSGSTRMIISAILPLVVAVTLFIFSAKFAFSKINTIRAQVALASRNQVVLSQKVALLQSISDTLSQGSAFAISALPQSNSSLVVISQLKSLAAQAAVTLIGIKASNAITDSSGLTRVDVSFEADGVRSNVISFIEAISTIAPITLVDKTKINESGGVVRANVTVKSYWSELPKTIPAVTQVINDLTPQEKTVLTQVSGLTQPTFSNVAPASEPERIDPFSP